MSYQKKEEKEEKIRETVKLASQIQNRSQQLFALAGILAFTDKLIDRKTVNEIRRAIEMTQVERIFEEEKRQALAELEARKALEMTQAAKMFEEEKRQALAELEAKILSEMAKTEEERSRELAKMEEEKQQAARESVIKMIRKNYSSEEIAYIISGFSLDDIEEVRKEIAGAE